MRNPRHILRNWLARHISYSVAQTVNGRRVRIPVLLGLGSRKVRPHEPEVSAMISVLLRTYSGTFLDIGINFGQTLLKVVTHEWERPYVGFEPSITCCWYVERLIAANRLRNCSILPIALADCGKAVALHFNREGDAAATILKDFWCGVNEKALRKFVWAERGDAVLQSLDLTDIAIIKIDVEGAELDVLAGLAETLRRFKPPVVLEVLPYSCDIAKADENSPAIANRKARMERLVSLLRDFSYSAYRYQTDGTVIETIDFDAPRYDATMCNYILLPRESEMLSTIRDRYAKALHGAGR